MCREELDSWALLSSRFALFSILYHSCPHYHGVVLLKQLWCFHHKHIHLQFWSNKPDNFLFNGAKKNTKMSCMRLVFSHNTGPAQSLPAFKQKSLVCCSKSMAVWGEKPSCSWEPLERGAGWAFVLACLTASGWEKPLWVHLCIWV